MRKRFFHLLSRAHKSVKTRVERETRDAVGLTNLELGALWALASDPALGVQELARVLQVDHAVVSRLSKQLVRKGVVSRRPDPEDARRTQLALSALGAAKADQGLVLLGHANAHLAEGFTEAELAVVARFLEHLIAFGADLTPLLPPDAPVGPPAVGVARAEPDTVDWDDP